MPDSSVVLYIGPPKKFKIPKSSFIVTTTNSIYRFGRANKKGHRTIKRLLTDENKHGHPLEFTRCKVLQITSSGMNMNCVDGPEYFRRDGCHTSRVLEVQTVKKNKTAN